MRKQKLVELNEYLRLLKSKNMQKLDQPSQFINTEVYEFELSSGIKFTREKILKGKRDGSAAIILPITVEKEILLVIQPRVFSKTGIGIELPAGYIEDETSVLAAKRELLEETGYQSKKIEFIGSFYQDEGCSSALNQSFIAYECVKIKDQYLDKDEFIKYFTCDYEEVLELMNLGYINGANSLLTINFAQKKLAKMIK